MKIKSFFKYIYDKLVHIDDTPHKIAAGFGLGVFFGILPGVGPVAALCIAAILKFNKISAFTAGLLTNTWLSLVTFVLSLKIGTVLTGLDWQQTYQKTQEVVKQFHWKSLIDSSILIILQPLIIGYAIIGMVAGLLSYFIILCILKRKA